MSATDKPKTFSVLVYDMYDYGEVATVNGFKTFDEAREYARRRTRDSVENERRASTDAKDLHDRWFSARGQTIVLAYNQAQQIAGQAFKAKGEKRQPWFSSWLTA